MIDREVISYTSIGAELSLWVRRHWLHVLLSPLIFLLFTVVHEVAHVLAASIQGATITDFSVLPSGDHLGHMNYEFPPGIDGSRELVSLAPYAFWGLCMLAVLLLSLRRSGFPFPIASSLFLWGFVGAWGDIALAAVSWLESGRGDWSHIFGQSDGIDVFAMGLVWLIVVGLGYALQKRLYREGALSKASYAVVFGAASTALVLATSILR